MKVIFSLKREHYMERLSVFLIAVVLIAGVVGCAGGGGVEYNLTISSTAGGNVTTPGEGTRTYDAGKVVNLVATPDSGYHFVNWTGDVSTIANVNAATTTVTMNGDYSITANFALGAVTYALTINSTAGGNVTTPGEGTYNYTAGTVANLVATPDSGYHFVNWTGDVSTIANVNAAATNITMNGDYSIMANFEVIPSVQYDLTTSSTAGGDVTTPGEATYTYDAGKVVNLVATPDAMYHFVKWTGNVGTIANVNAATTTITMNGNYTITANFGFNMTFITGVPDTSWPPTNTLNSTFPGTSYCAPLAMANILEYWDDVANHANAQNVTAGLIPETVAEYIGYCMDTNNKGLAFRLNDTDGHRGTYGKDIRPGTLDFVRFDATHPLCLAPANGTCVSWVPLPAGKLGYNWTGTDDYAVGFNFSKAEIDAGRPLVVCFRNWWLISTGISVTDPETGETIDVFGWSLNPPPEPNPNPPEYWNNADYGPICIGHAVTGVGYILNWDPDGAGLLPQANYVIVHDTWATTPKNIAIFWPGPWSSSHAVNPG